MCVLDVHRHVLGVVDLLFYRDAEIALEHSADPQRQRTALDQLARVAHFEDRRAGERLEPGTLRQANPGAETDFTAFQTRRALERFGAQPEHSPFLDGQSDMI